MKRNDGIINHVNYKLLAGALVLTVLTAPLVGCSDSNNDFEYNRNSQGQYEVIGTIDYGFLKECYFTVFKDNNFDTTEFYITNRISDKSHSIVYGYEYVDILSGKEVFSRNIDSDISNKEKNNINLVTEIKLEDYLYSLEKVKNTYTSDDVEEILLLIKTEYSKVNNKQLVKGK